MVSQRCLHMRNRARQVLQKAKEKTGVSEEVPLPQDLLEVSSTFRQSILISGIRQESKS